ncbi:MAG TPA: hypothetical protein PL001_01170 [Candidatus Kryptobacter bacterium]|nr:hypothetical protein [Candidatus Kryptobacter bacterium]
MKIVVSIVLIRNTISGTNEILNSLSYHNSCGSLSEAEGKSIRIVMKENPTYLVSTLQSMEIKD